MRAPSPRSTTNGSPPTPPNARAVEVGDAVDVIRLPHRARLRLAIDHPVDHRTRRTSNEPFIPLGRDLSLQIHQSLETLALHRFRYVIDHRCGARSFLRRVGE